MCFLTGCVIHGKLFGVSLVESVHLALRCVYPGYRAWDLVHDCVDGSNICCIHEYKEIISTQNILMSWQYNVDTNK